MLSDPPWVVEIDGIKFATPEAVVLLLKAVSEERDELEARVQRLTEAIQKVLDDEESGEGWGPDVTTVAYLREAIDG